MRISDWSSDVCSSDLARDALVQLLCNTARTLNDLIKIEGGLFPRQAVFFGLLHIMIYFARAKQRLRRDAPPVQADAAQILALHNRSLQSEMTRTDRRDIASRSRATHDMDRSEEPTAALQSVMGSAY